MGLLQQAMSEPFQPMDTAPKDTITEHLARIIPHGDKCHGCPKSDPRGIEGYTGDVFCHLFEEVMPDGNKECGINQPISRQCEGCGAEIPEGEILFGFSDRIGDTQLCGACWKFVNSTEFCADDERNGR